MTRLLTAHGSSRHCEPGIQFQCCGGDSGCTGKCMCHLCLLSFVVSVCVYLFVDNQLENERRMFCDTVMVNLIVKVFNCKFPWSVRVSGKGKVDPYSVYFSTHWCRRFYQTVTIRYPTRMTNSKFI